VKKLIETGNIYINVNVELSRRINNAANVRDRNKVLREKERTDAAFFALLFGQFENILTMKAESLVCRRKNLNNWKNARPWQAIEDGRKLDFKKRLALTVRKGFSDYNTIDRLYSQRNKIDHGNSGYTVNMPQDMIDLIRIAGIINKLK
jgi:hypothetical protein